MPELRTKPLVESGAHWGYFCNVKAINKRQRFKWVRTNGSLGFIPGLIEDGVYWKLTQQKAPFLFGNRAILVFSCSYYGKIPNSA